jgi:hypothetical protein
MSARSSGHSAKLRRASVEIGETIELGQIPAPQRAAVPACPVRIGCKSSCDCNIKFELAYTHIYAQDTLRGVVVPP